MLGIRGWIYDQFLIGLTSRWYAEVIELLPDGARLLDVGIGTGSALLVNADQIKAKELHITGIDIDRDYIERAHKRIKGSSLNGRVEVMLESIYNHHSGPYDAIYFSASFMILPDPEGALRHCQDLLKSGGKIYFTQTIQNAVSPVLDKIKPILGRLTTIEFGRVTYADEFRSQIQAASLQLETFRTIASHGPRSYCLAVARPVA